MTAKGGRRGKPAGSGEAPGPLGGLREWIRRHRATHDSVTLGVLLALTGGYLDAYTFVGHGGVFANAQTGNLVLIGVELARGNGRELLVYVPPILAFVLGVLAAETIMRTPRLPAGLDWGRIVLVLETALLVGLGLLPPEAPNLVTNGTISFVAAVQTSAFKKLVDSPYSTTMCTGNLRSAAQALYAALVGGDRWSLVRAGRYLLIVGVFTLGALLGALATPPLGNRSAWGAALLLAGALALYVEEERKKTLP